MRFLCLHGVGTSSQVFETQLATIKYELESHHIYEFVEGNIPVPIAEEIKAFYPPTDQYYQFYDPYSAASVHDALSQLYTYVSLEGPFDGVIGFSQGASLAATFLIQQSHDDPLAPLPFKCAIFLSGGKPLDPKALERGEIVLIDPTQTGPLLHLPTANVWGRNDTLWPGSCETLCDLCDESMRSVAIHDEGHDVPGAKDKEAVQGAVRAIRRTIDKALLTQ